MINNGITIQSERPDVIWEQKVSQRSSWLPFCLWLGTDEKLNKLIKMILETLHYFFYFLVKITPNYTIYLKTLTSIC